MRRYKGIIFDLEGVLLSTDDFHNQSWKEIADKLGIPFERKFNEKFRGVSRTACLELLLSEDGKALPSE